MNSVLPNDLVVISAEQMPMNFHSRFDVKQKTYRYTVYNDRIRDVFRRNYTWYYPHPLDLNAMIDASRTFLGEHDFTSFSSTKTDKQQKVRTIYNFSVRKEEREIIFEITGNGFLRNMVRIIVGTLIEVGRGRMDQSNIQVLFEERDRTLAGLTAPPQGLVLWDVQY
ncbi:tRNA pseudouridine synthase A [Tepidibacillus marianensis]|uniref:tRNA pseudouridine synthase A n=1 Tax=Tepidibacillus marianensis TaxID=3131995 RepID=UPI0030CA737D